MNENFIEIIIEALEQSAYEYTLDNDSCGSGCCSEKIELIDIDKFKSILREHIKEKQ